MAGAQFFGLTAVSAVLSMQCTVIGHVVPTAVHRNHPTISLVELAPSRASPISYIAIGGTAAEGRYRIVSGRDLAGTRGVNG